MPFSQEDLMALAGLVITAAGGGFGVARLQKAPPPALPSGGDGSETLQAIERVGLKVDSVSRQLGNVKNVVDGVGAVDFFIWVSLLGLKLPDQGRLCFRPQALNYLRPLLGQGHPREVWWTAYSCH